MFEIGDKVKVLDATYAYPNYIDWFKVKFPCLLHFFWKSNKPPIKKEKIYTVVAHEKHLTLSKYLYAIADEDNNLYLINGMFLEKKEFEPGGLVTIVDQSKMYSTFYDWFDKNVPHLSSRYAYTVNNPPSNYKTYIILAKGPENDDSPEEMLYAISPYEDYIAKEHAPIFLIGEKGIKPAN